MHLSNMHVESSGALIGGAIGGSLALGLVIVISSLVALLILVLVCRRPLYQVGLYAEDMNVLYVPILGKCIMHLY